MERAIKFRGKDSFSGEWLKFEMMVDGKLCHQNVYSYFWSRVLPKTVGQFIGCKDSEGVEIFEGDIIEITDGYTMEPTKHEVRYYAGQGYPAFDLEPSFDDDANGISSAINQASVRVVGNIHENVMDELRKNHPFISNLMRATDVENQPAFFA